MKALKKTNSSNLPSEKNDNYLTILNKNSKTQNISKASKVFEISLDDKENLPNYTNSEMEEISRIKRKKHSRTQSIVSNDFLEEIITETNKPSRNHKKKKSIKDLVKIKNLKNLDIDQINKDYDEEYNPQDFYNPNELGIDEDSLEKIKDLSHSNINDSYYILTGNGSEKKDKKDKKIQIKTKEIDFKDIKKLNYPPEDTLNISDLNLDNLQNENTKEIYNSKSVTSLKNTITTRKQNKENITDSYLLALNLGLGSECKYKDLHSIIEEETEDLLTDSALSIKRKSIFYSTKKKESEDFINVVVDQKMSTNFDMVVLDINRKKSIEEISIKNKLENKKKEVFELFVNKKHSKELTRDQHYDQFNDNSVKKECTLSTVKKSNNSENSRCSTKKNLTCLSAFNEDFYDQMKSEYKNARCKKKSSIFKSEDLRVSASYNENYELEEEKKDKKDKTRLTGLRFENLISENKISLLINNKQSVNIKDIKMSREISIDIQGLISPKIGSGLEIQSFRQKSLISNESNNNNYTRPNTCYNSIVKAVKTKVDTNLERKHHKAVSSSSVLATVNSATTTTKEGNTKIISKQQSKQNKHSKTLSSLNFQVLSNLNTYSNLSNLKQTKNTLFQKNKSVNYNNLKTAIQKEIDSFNCKSTFKSTNKNIVQSNIIGKNCNYNKSRQEITQEIRKETNTKTTDIDLFKCNSSTNTLKNSTIIDKLHALRNIPMNRYFFNKVIMLKLFLSLKKKQD